MSAVMVYKFPGFIIGIGLLMATVLISGCATDRINHINDRSILLERVPSEDVHVSKAYAYENGDKLVVYGKVKRGLQNCCDPARGHVDIAVLGPEGTILDVTSTLYSPRNIPKARTRSSHFTALLPYILPDEVSIKIAYHSSLETADSLAFGSGRSECEQNIAIPDNDKLIPL